jgi:SRSO17 transposase
MDRRPDRCRAAGIPDEVTFATKPELAIVMLTQAQKAGVPFAWVPADTMPAGTKSSGWSTS